MIAFGFSFFFKDSPLHADMEVAPDIPGAFMEDLPGAPPALYMQSFDNPVYTVPSAQVIPITQFIS